jgi:hypothetical protein
MAAENLCVRATASEAPPRAPRVAPPDHVADIVSS